MLIWQLCSNGSLIERVLARHATVCWQRLSRDMADLGEWGGGQRTEERKTMEKSGGQEEDGEM